MYNSNIQKQNIIQQNNIKNSTEKMNKWDVDYNKVSQLAEYVKPTDDGSVNINKKNTKLYNSSDYLPKEINDEWFNTDFLQAENKINDNKLINTDKYITGIDTTGQSLKNPTYDIRGTIPNPKISVSPWNNSTYEPDYNLKSLC